MKNFAKKLDFDIPRELQPYVVGVILGESDSIVNASYPVHPTGFPLLINSFMDLPLLRIDGQLHCPQSRLNVAGQVFNANIELEFNGKLGQIGLVLYPTAPYYLFHKKGDYLLNKIISIDEVTPLNTDDLLGNLSHCSSLKDRADLLMGILCGLNNNRLSPISWLDASLSEIFSRHGIVSQTELLDKIRLGSRHFRRKFKEIIGVSPKYYCKVIQLNTIFELLKIRESEKLHHLALDCGYYDQSHFINDFNRLIGESPEKFLNGEHAFVKTYLGQGMGLA
ncbi:helix-turn-helix domain-containing protein [Flavobacteriaceae bacterium F89]|uniref:Helix-turn-helix domain-containing protein n=1 Tax=Cerina litoralis TaxID=2874477 RepID=A0AAE3EXV6_9FLAO|nr:helix-turn-helix domain-containing protein [Cerina litoralis]MCG2461586.1 helix-turn-helix domain-containing protein [Cerina litoralis]